MTNALLLAIIGALGSCAAFFWLHPKYDDCVWGRLGLLGTLGGFMIVIWSSFKGYVYSMQPEVLLILGGQAVYMLWLVWRFLRKNWRIATGLDHDDLRP